MFNLGGIDDLARALGVSFDTIHEVLDDFDRDPASLVSELTLWRADQTKKPRDVIAIKRRWRLIQERIYLKLLLPWFEPSRCCHGGVKRRSPATNARMHLHNTHAFVTDISSFFPSIGRGRVNKLLLSKGCSYDVARVLTRLCTYNHHLALGLVTSPIIANEILRIIDAEIEQFCRKNGLAYSRFIDDITISGMFDLRRMKLDKIIRAILSRHHFDIAKDKTNYGRLDVVTVNERTDENWPPLAITGVRLKGNHLDPSRTFVDEIERILADHASLANDGHFVGPLYMQSEVFGKVYYACSLNSGRRRCLLAKMKNVDWFKVLEFAADRWLVRSRDRLAPRGQPRPNCTEELPLAAGAKYVRQYYETHSYDPSEAPFDVPEKAVTTTSE